MASKKRRSESLDDEDGGDKAGVRSTKKQKTQDSATSTKINSPTKSKGVSSSSTANNYRKEQNSFGEGGPPETSSPDAGPSQPRSSPDQSKSKNKQEGLKKQKKLREEATNERSLRSSIRKLAPPRPFPTVPTSVSATGPRSAHKEGKNYICITRKTRLGNYLRRCKDTILKDGYKTLYLHAMGAAIPHLARLVISLPSILPFAPDEIRTEIFTGTAELKDEVIPDDEDEDITLQTRGKSTMRAIIWIGDGDKELGIQTNTKDSKKNKKKRQKGKPTPVSEGAKSKPQLQELVFKEGELEDHEMEEE